MKRAFPYYLSIGMTYEQYWNQDVELVKYYREAEEIRQNRKNHESWLQGAYFYEALLDASPVLKTNFSKKPVKPAPYRDQPYQLTSEKPSGKQKAQKEQQEEKSDSKAKAVMEMFMTSFNKRFEKKEGGNDG